MFIKLLSIILCSTLLSGCFKKLPKKKAETTTPEQVEVPIPFFEGPGEGQRNERNSFTLVPSKTITSVGDLNSNYILLTVIPGQEVFYRIKNNSGELGQIKTLNGQTYFVPGESSGNVEIEATNGEFTTSVRIVVNGELLARDAQVVSKSEPGNFITLNSSGGVGEITYSLVSGNNLGRISDGKFYPVKFADFYEIYRNQINQENIPTDHLVVNYKAQDQNGNSANGQIRIYPEMILKFFDNSNDENSISANQLKLLCSESTDGTYPLKNIKLKVFGGIKPLNILNPDGNVQFSPLEDEGYLTVFQITPPTSCVGEELRTFFIEDAHGNQSKIDIRLFENFRVSQNTDQLNLTAQSSIRSENANSVEEDDLDDTRIVSNNEGLILTLSGGQAPYRVTDSNGQIEYRIRQIEGNDYKIAGFPLDSENVNLRVYENFGSFNEVSFSLRSGIVTTVSNNILNSSSILNYLRVTPNTSKISLISDSSNFSRELNFYTGENLHNYNDFELGNNKSAFFFKSDGFNSSNNYELLNFKVTDMLGVDYYFSRKMYFPLSFQVQNLDNNYVNIQNSLINSNFPPKELSTSVNNTFKGTLDLFTSNYKRHYPYGSRYLSIGGEQFVNLKLTNGFNDHKKRYKNTYTINDNELPLPLLNSFVSDAKSCSIGETYGNFARAFNNSSMSNREGRNFFFRFDFSGIIRLLFPRGVVSFNNFIRSSDIFSIKFRQQIHDNSGDPGDFLFPISDSFGKKYFTDELQAELKIDSTFEYRKRPLKIPSLAQEISTVGKVVGYKINHEGQDKVCFKYVENYSSHYNSRTFKQDSEFALRSLSNMAIDERLSEVDSLDSYCIEGSNLVSTNDMFYFLDDQKRLNSIKPNLNANSFGIELNYGSGTIGLGQEGESDLNLYNSSIYEVLSSQKIDEEKKVVVVKTNFVPQINIDGCTNEKIGIYQITGNFVQKKLLNYFPIDQVNKNSSVFIDQNNQYLYLLAAKKDENCSALEKVILKVSLSENSVEEVTFSELGLDESYDYFDFEIMKNSNGEEYLFLSGTRRIFKSGGSLGTFITVPFLSKISLDLSEQWLQTYDRNENSCIYKLIVSNPHIVNYKTDFNDNRVSLLFDLEGKYLKGGSLIRNLGDNLSDKDIGRLEIDYNSGNPLYFRRFESVDNVENYKLVIPDTLNFYPQLSIIKTGTGDQTQFFEIPYYTDK